MRGSRCSASWLDHEVARITLQGAKLDSMLRCQKCLMCIQVQRCCPRCQPYSNMLTWTTSRLRQQLGRLWDMQSRHTAF